jgi:hypothetical protein
VNTITMHIGDVRDVMATLPDNYADLLVTSPPFLALRSYLPADHPDKHREIGSEPTPAAFLDTLYGLTADWGRLVPEWGSICVELGDTMSGSGGAGGDYNTDGLREGQAKFRQSGWHRLAPQGSQTEATAKYRSALSAAGNQSPSGGPGWPLAKSMCLMPHAYTIGLAYGHNPLYGPVSAEEALAWIDDLRAYGMSAEQALAVVGGWVAEHGNPHKHPAGQWRIRNVITWARPNPPVGSLGKRNPEKRTGDYKFRPACSFITVACRGTGRYFDLDAVRTAPGTGQRNSERSMDNAGKSPGWVDRNGHTGYRGWHDEEVDSPRTLSHPAGAPPLDWHTDDLDGDWLWKLATAPYPGSHYATYPLALPRRLVLAMCPLLVCSVCGWPRERVTLADYSPHGNGRQDENKGVRGVVQLGEHAQHMAHGRATKNVTTLGFTDCGHDNYRPGHVLDPFGGSGTTAVAAALEGRDATLIDIDRRNVDLVRRRLAENVRIVSEVHDGDTVTWTVEPVSAVQVAADAAGQGELFAS